MSLLMNLKTSIYRRQNISRKRESYPKGRRFYKLRKIGTRRKILMKALQIPVSPFAVITRKSEIQPALEKIGFPAVIKTCQGGYDGKGQLKINSIADLSLVEQFTDENGDRFIIEKWLTFDREISIVLTRDDRKSTRLNSSHVAISYAVFCLKKKIEQ